MTRALAFVTFAMINAKQQCVSCLLLVSPVKVLAGVAVGDTLEFLLQLCVVCKSVDREIREAAAQEVLHKGDAILYKSSVSFRRGLVLVQAVIRTFIRRRMNKRRAIELNSHPGSAKLELAVGTKFLKELPHGGICEGIIRSVDSTRYILSYIHDADAEDEVGEWSVRVCDFAALQANGITDTFRLGRTDEIEMKIILEESQRLRMYHNRNVEAGRRISKRNSTPSDDTDISLTSLPDLSVSHKDGASPVDSSTNPRLIKRVTSRDSGIAMATPKPRSLTVRTLSHRQPSSNLSPLSKGVGSMHALSLGTVGSGVLDNSPVFESHTQDISQVSGEPSTKGANAGYPRVGGEGPETADDSSWQASFKRIIDDGRHTDPTTLLQQEKNNDRGVVPAPQDIAAPVPRKTAPPGDNTPSNQSSDIPNGATR